jgi:hypothetical protein
MAEEEAGDGSRDGVQAFRISFVYRIVLYLLHQVLRLDTQRFYEGRIFICLIYVYCMNKERDCQEGERKARPEVIKIRIGNGWGSTLEICIF